MGGKMVKGHPGYSGGILTATYEMARDLGWSYSRTGRPARHAGPVRHRSAEEDRGGRAGSHGRWRRACAPRLEGAGAPVELVYPAEGAPSGAAPSAV